MMEGVGLARWEFRGEWKGVRGLVRLPHLMGQRLVT